MADSPDPHDSGEADAKRSEAVDAGEAEDAEQQDESPAAAPAEEPRRPRHYGYDPDQWPELG